MEGRASIYKGRIQLILSNVELVEEDKINREDFLPITPKNREEMFTTIMNIIEGIKNPYLKQLLNSFFEDSTWVKYFNEAPAAKKNHQAYLGGLLEHTFNMIALVPSLCAIYPQVDQDLLYTGVILHDIAKIKEYEYEYKIDFTDAGRLLGHIVMGIQEVDQRITSIEGFPEKLRLKVLHMIASHHGQYEWQSPKRPKFLEACLLHHLDLIDTEVFIFNSISENTQEAWSWSNNLGRYIFKEDND
ncbi:MAG: 3-5 exoribonuclease [Clostridia bacterium]|nr:3-5 exoribonuclease [Clostridia bacterium]